MESHEEQLQVEKDRDRDSKAQQRLQYEKSHDSYDDIPIIEKKYPTNCEICGRGFYLEVEGLSYEEREKIGYGYKVIRYNDRLLCPHCLVRQLWEDGHRTLSLTKGGDMDKDMIVKEPIVMPAVSKEKALEAFRAYQDLAKEICTEDDVQEIQGKPFKKKSFWRKCQRFFNLSLEKIAERREEVDSKFVYHFVYRAIAPNGAYVDGCGSCSSDEKGLTKTEHTTRAIAETRAKNRAIADLCAFGEVSAEEISVDNEKPVFTPAKATKDEIDKRQELYQLLITINNGNDTQSELERILEDITAFTAKDGNEVKGVRSLKDLKGKRLDVVIGKAKKIVEENTLPEE